MWFKSLSDEERRIIRTVWRWKDEGRPSGKTPLANAKMLDALIAKLWVLQSKYKVAVMNVEEIINDIESLEDKQSVEESEDEKQNLDSCVDKLKEIIQLLEWLRSNKTQ